MKILLSLTHPQVVGTKQLFGTIDFHSRKKKCYGSQWFPTTVWFQSLHIIIVQGKL